MLINGEKWACETCIKGHRATHCKHTDRKLVSIKKKGRPSTQCKRCRELRMIRQLHVKCDCEDQSLRISKKKKETNNNSSIAALKKKMKIDVLRPIAPKQEHIIPTPISTLTPPLPEIAAAAPVAVKSGCCGGSKKKKESISSSSSSPSTPPLFNNAVTQASVSCCGSSSKTTKSSSTPPLPLPQPSSPVLPLEPVPLPNIPPPSSCCGPPSKNQQGETIRVVTCRCGDSCACIGCDAHPSRAMKEGKNDVYIGFDNHNNNRRLSIAAICATPTTLPKLYIQPPALSSSSSSEMDHPTSVLSEDGVVLCGCGCSSTFEDCSDCFRELCQGYL